jgi:hypothetical protein
VSTGNNHSESLSTTPQRRFLLDLPASAGGAPDVDVLRKMTGFVADYRGELCEKSPVRLVERSMFEEIR